MAKTASQIADVVKRGAGDAYAEFRVHMLGEAVKSLPEGIASFKDFVPIHLVTLLETTVRALVAQAVDGGEPYRERGAALLARAGGRALTVDVLLSVSAQQLTLGHLVSHAISTSSLADILSALRTILGEGVRDGLAAATERWSEDEGKDVPRIIPDIDACLGSVDRLLAVRHILVHEMPRSSPYDPGELPAFIEHVRAFVSALRWLLVERTQGRVPRTQTEMNGWAARACAEAEDELAALTGPVPATLAECQTLSDKVEYFWQQFSAHAADLAGGYGGEDWPGTIAPMLRSSSLEHLTRWRIGEIKRARNKEEGEL